MLWKLFLKCMISMIFFFARKLNKSACIDNRNLSVYQWRLQDFQRNFRWFLLLFEKFIKNLNKIGFDRGLMEIGWKFFKISSKPKQNFRFSWVSGSIPTSNYSPSIITLIFPLTLAKNETLHSYESRNFAFLWNFPHNFSYI